MSKLFDQVAFGTSSGLYMLEGNSEEVMNCSRNQLRSAVLLGAGNLLDAFLEWQEKFRGKEILSTDLRNCIPPWGSVFVDAGILTERDGKTLSDVGFHVETKVLGNHCQEEIELFSKNFPRKVKYVSHIHCWFREHRRPGVTFHGGLAGFFDYQGQLLGSHMMLNYPQISSLSMFPLFAFQMVHCRNIVIAEHPVHRPRMLKGRRNKAPKIRYITLAISDTLVRREGVETSGEHAGVSKHICRGSFAHYTEEKKLFGKYTGSFWRPMHIRGSSQHGIVGKEYELAEAAE